jgi:2',3'-cyclic-nucleotide 2'-phosphodiesterase (5'-nucleotidase family)
MFLLLSLLICIPSTHAARVQILHTNDLHSYFAGTRDGHGGYARLKTLVDQLKAQGKDQGLETLFIDGGDFGEGASFYVADNGAESIRMLGRLGVDVTVIGNHDTMQGGAGLADQIRRANASTEILSANLNTELARSLQGLVKPLTVKTLAGKRIAIAGLTTAELHYQYPVLNEGKILNPLSKISFIEAQARKARADVVIALTHIGLKLDRDLVRRSRHIHLVVGGHSHTRLEKAETVRNRRNRPIPIVQAGAHSLGLGQIILEIPDRGEPRMVSYKLHSVTSAVAENAVVQAAVTEAKKLREGYFQRDWGESIGSVEFPLHGHVQGQNPVRASCWGGHIAQVSREATDADVGIHVSGFTGETIPAGPITFGDLIDNYPHFRAFGDRGWTLAKVRLPGAIINGLAAFLRTHPSRYGLNLSFRTRIENTKTYTLAFPGEMSWALEQIAPILKGHINGRVEQTNAALWESLEIYLRARSPLTCP